MKPIKNIESFGKRLRSCRLHKGFSQTDLADILKTNNQVISRYERDEMRPSIDVAIDLAKALGTSAGYLLGEQKFHDDPELEAIFRDLRSVPENELSEIKTTLVNLIKASRFRVT